jgi:iron(III) transport system substrate-binding protein
MTARQALVFLAALLPAAAGAQQLTDAMRQVMKERKVPMELLKGLDQELAIPPAWVAGAKKEGKLRVTMTMDEQNFEKVRKVFNARYPGIDIEYARGVGQRRALAPLLAFRRGTYISDIVSSFEVLKDEYAKSDALAKIVGVLPAVKSLDKTYIDEDGLAVAYRLTNYCMAYALNRVKKEELPKTWDELLTNPRWRNGKVGMAANANVWIAELWALKGEKWGQDYVRRIFTDLKPQLRKENLQTIGRLAALGEYDIAIPSSDANTYDNAQDGIKVGYHCPDIVPVSAANVGILKNNPHMNASLIFVNWLLSKEGQITINWADFMTPANVGLQRREMLFYPDEVIGRKKAPLDEKVSRMMPQIMEFWQGHWMKAGGTPPGEGGDKGAKKAPR